MEEKAHELTL